MMNLEDLQKEKLIERIPLEPKLVKSAFTIAERDIKAAADNLRDKNFDWCYAIAYNAMLQAGRALMFSRGLRPTREGDHAAVVRFAAIIMVGDSSILATIFNKFRLKRHPIIYEQADLVAAAEAARAVEKAKNFVSKTGKLIESG